MSVYHDSESIVSTSCIRALLMLFNLAFWVSGLSIIWMGIWMQTDFQYALKISSYYSVNGPYVLLAVGALIVFVTSLACSCILKTEANLLAVYGGFCIAMLFTLISLSIYVNNYKDQIVKGIPAGMRVGIHLYDLESSSSADSSRNLIDSIQKNLQCCGIDTHNDWGERTTPDSCCWNREFAPTCDTKKSYNLYAAGCARKLKSLINENLTNMGVTMTAVSLFPLFGTILAFVLATISDKGNYGDYERIV